MLNSVIIKVPPKKLVFHIRAAKSVAEGGLFDSKANTFTNKNRHIICTYLHLNLDFGEIAQH